MPHIRRRVLCGGLLVCLAGLAPAPALAAPVTVDLRIEGPTSTLFEGPVTTDVRPFRFTTGADTAEHQCDGTTTGGTAGAPSPTRGAAVMAAVDQGLTTSGVWYDAFGAAFNTINGESVAYDGATNRYLVEFENFQATSVGACADTISPGDQVLFAFSTGSEPLLKLTGPATAAPGATVAVKVTDGQSGAAVDGATVGGVTTGADGTAVVGPLTQRGDHDLKAAKAGTVRSNRLRVCVTDGADGFCGTTKPGDPAPVQQAPACVSLGDDGLCGTTDTRAPGGSIGSVREQQRFARGKGPRTLSGRATDAQGIRRVELRLTRTDRRRCSTFDGARERFVRLKRCGASRGRWFEAGTGGDWTYLLPSRLPRGRYVLDVRSTDGTGNVDRRLERGRNRIVFHVA